jgi:non-specific serine/threonine protein kinase
MSKRWSLECFGAFRARDEAGRIIERFRTHKTAALLAFLALSRGPQRREELCALLWPDAAPEAGRNSLSAALSSLRRELGDDLVCADRNFVRLAAGAFTTDVAEFDAALRDGNFARAVELFNGPLLPGFDEEYFHLLCSEYAEKARGAFDARLQELESAADWPSVRSLARRAASVFGNDTQYFNALMRAQYGAGDLHAALRVYEDWQKWARRENELVPDAARQLARKLRREKESELSAALPLPAPAVEAASSAGTSVTSTQASESTVSGGSLPPPWTRFFGREAEMELLGKWLFKGETLVTLTGAGGSGKTRLAIETLRRLPGEWQGGIYFVPLASLWDASLLFSTVRDALGIVASPDVPPLEQIAGALRGQKCVVLLDNLEQLSQSGAAHLQELRERLPQTTFMVTSRALLHLPGEREFSVMPLPTPLENALPDELGEYPSAALFCDRAGLPLTPANSAAIGALCRRLDGIPLALELAAARARVLSPAQIVERLEQRFDFLQGRELGLAPRHRTLRATIEWSTDLLEPHLRDFFARLSVFRGGWTLEAAETICAPGVCEEWDVLDFLEQLRASSLISTLHSASGTRYRLLEMLREWGDAQLSHEQRAELQARHYAFYTHLVENALDPVALAQRSEELAAENGNFRAALRFALECNEPQCANDAARLAGALGGFWEARARHSEGYEWVERALQTRGEIEPTFHARLLCCGGVMLFYCGDYLRAQALLEQGLELYRALSDKRGEAWALDYLGKVFIVRGRSEDTRLYGEAAMTIARETGDTARLISSLVTAAWGCHNTRCPLEAVAHFDECLNLCNAVGERRLATMCEGTRAFSLLMTQSIEECRAQCYRALEAADESVGLYPRSFALGTTAITLLELGEVEHARSILPHIAANFHSISTRWEVASMLYICGNLAVALDRFESAAILYGASQALSESASYIMLPCLSDLFEPYRLRLEAALSPQAKERLWQQGRQMPLDEAVALTQTLLPDGSPA